MIEILNGRTESLLVKVVTPAAYSLSKYETGGDKVGDFEEANLLPAGVDKRTEQAAYNRAVNRKSAFPNV